jgi:hypothetical protein
MDVPLSKLLKPFRTLGDPLLFVVIGGGVFIWLTVRVLDAALRPTAFYTGVGLLVLCAFLTLLNARKKLPFLPLGSAKAWLRFHVCVGWLSVVVFGFHVDWGWPQSGFNATLAAAFLIVALSGVVGIWLSRHLPPRLARSGEPLTYERLPRLRAELVADARRLCLPSSEAKASGGDAAASTTFGDFYVRRLHPYLHSRVPWLLALRDVDVRHRAVAADLRALRRYMNDAERTKADELASLIEATRNLDFQQSAQRLLKLWLFVHIPFTYGLLILVAAHVLIILAYRANW